MTLHGQDAISKRLFPQSWLDCLSNKSITFTSDTTYGATVEFNSVISSPNNSHYIEIDNFSISNDTTVWQNTNICGNDKDYRYVFNGEEHESAISGDLMVYDLGARFYDSRLGRMFSVDPLSFEYPFQSTYVYCYISPIWVIDYKGLGGEPKSKLGDEVQSGEGLIAYMARNGMDYYNPNDRETIAKLNPKIFPNGVVNGKYMLYGKMRLNVVQKETEVSNEESSKDGSPQPSVSIIAEGEFSEFEWCQLPEGVETMKTSSGGETTLATSINFRMDMRGSFVLYKGISIDVNTNTITQNDYWTLKIYGGITNTINMAKPSYAGDIIVTIDGKEFEFPFKAANNSICNGYCFESTIYISNFQKINNICFSISVGVCTSTGSTGGVCAVDNMWVQTPCTLDVEHLIKIK